MVYLLLRIISICWLTTAQYSKTWQVADFFILTRINTCIITFIAERSLRLVTLFKLYWCIVMFLTMWLFIYLELFKIFNHLTIPFMLVQRKIAKASFRMDFMSFFKTVFEGVSVPFTVFRMRMSTTAYFHFLHLVFSVVHTEMESFIKCTLQS